MIQNKAMSTLALLRGINVGGHRKVPMPALKAAFEQLGLSNVQTYIQSGNVVFESEISREALEAELEAAFGFPLSVALRTAEQWAGMIARNPYPNEAAQDGSKVHVFLLDAEPSEERLAALRTVASGADEWICVGRELYLHTPNGIGRTKLNPERTLKVGATARNWRTVEKLGEMLESAVG